MSPQKKIVTITARIAPFQPEVTTFRAGRLMLQEIESHPAHGHSVAFETTLSGLTYVRMIAGWRSSGHNIPTETIRRRFAAGLTRFKEIYRHRVDSWQLFNNSGEFPVLIEEGGKE